MTCPRVSSRLRNPKNREVIGLGPSAGEDQPIGLEAVQVGPEDFGHPLPGVFQNAACPLARLMLACRVGISGRVAAGHGLDDLGPGGSGRVVVKINVIHQAIIRGASALPSGQQARMPAGKDVVPRIAAASTERANLSHD